MERILEVLDIVPGDGHFFSGVMGKRQEKGAIVLILDFLDHGKVHDVVLVCAEEAQGGERRDSMSRSVIFDSMIPLIV